MVLKKGGQKEGQAGNAVPNELPPLYEETQSASSVASVPEQLPPLEAPIQSEAVQQPIFSGFETKQIEEEIPPQAPPAPMHASFQGVQGVQRKENSGFFHDLFHLIKAPGAIDKLMSEDLLARMKDNWGLRNKEGEGLSSKEQLENELAEKLNELALLERRWRAQRIIIEEEEKLLKQREKDMNAKIAEFKKFLHKVKLYQQVPISDYLLLDNCAVIRNLKELAEVSKVIEEKVLRKHIKNGKNDISGWVMHIDPKLAAKLSSIKTKKEFRGIMEEYERKLAA